MPTSAELQGYIRAFMASMAGGLVTNGVLTADQLTQISNILAGLLLLLATIAWSKVSNSLKSMISHVAASPKVSAIMTTPEIANAEPSPKVTATHR